MEKNDVIEELLLAIIQGASEELGARIERVLDILIKLIKDEVEPLMEVEQIETPLRNKELYKETMKLINNYKEILVNIEHAREVAMKMQGKFK